MPQSKYIASMVPGSAGLIGSRPTGLLRSHRTPRATPLTLRPESREAVFRNEGEFWNILPRPTFRLKDTRGLHYIAYLLAHPNERFHVRDLAASKRAGNEPDRGDAAPILDQKAKVEYRTRLAELRADLDEAERMNDCGRAEQIRRRSSS